jgi:hypothetical protein
MANFITLNIDDLIENGEFEIDLSAFGFAVEETMAEADPAEAGPAQVAEIAETRPPPNVNIDNTLPIVNKAPTFVEISDEQKLDFINGMKNKNTTRKTDAVMKQFARWLARPPRVEVRDISDIGATELDNYVGSFLLNVRKFDGTQYEPDTLTSYHRAIDRYLREKNYPYSMVTDKEFKTSRQTLGSKRKELKQKGKGNAPNAAEPLTEGEERILKEKGILGTHSPRALTNKMWLQNTTMLGLRGGTESRKMCWGDLSLKANELGREYLEYNERETKTRTGETSSTHQRSFRPKIFATPDDSENCPVAAYKEFEKRRPPSMIYHEAPFYLATNYRRDPESQTWYKGQPLGENTLRTIIKSMAEKAELPGRKTNHSARKTTCTKLLHAGVAPTTIQQLTGHSNVQSINKYGAASN